MSVKTFFESLEANVESMWKKAPSALVAISSAVNYVVPFVESLDGIVVGPEAAAFNLILDKVKTGLSALAVTASGVGNTASIGSIVTSVNTNLAALEAASQIKDPALLSKIQSVVTLVSGELSAIVSSTAVSATK
jgi:hypothetical protein